jgi:flagellar biosynthesis chaperone FliJ
MYVVFRSVDGDPYIPVYVYTDVEQAAQWAKRENYKYVEIIYDVKAIESGPDEAAADAEQRIEGVTLDEFRRAPLVDRLRMLADSAERTGAMGPYSVMTVRSAATTIEKGTAQLGESDSRFEAIEKELESHRKTLNHHAAQLNTLYGTEVVIRELQDQMAAVNTALDKYVESVDALAEEISEPRRGLDARIKRNTRSIAEHRLDILQLQKKVRR